MLQLVMRMKKGMKHITAATLHLNKNDVNSLDVCMVNFS